MLCQAFAQLIRKKQKQQVDQGIEKSHRCGKAVALIHQTLSVYIGGDHVRRLINRGIIEQDDLLKTQIHHVSHAENEHGDDGGQNARQGHVPHLLEPARPVHSRRLIQLRIDSGYCRDIDDGAPAKALPDIRDHIDRLEKIGIQHHVLLRIAEQRHDPGQYPVRGRKLQNHSRNDHRRNEVGHIADRLHHLFEFLSLYLVQKQREQDGRREPEDQILQVDADGIPDQPSEIHTVEKFPEVPQPGPGAVKDAELRRVVPERDLGAVHGIIAKHQIKRHDGQNHEIQSLMSLYILPESGGIAFFLHIL